MKTQLILLGILFAMSSCGDDVSHSSLSMEKPTDGPAPSRSRGPTLSGKEKKLPYHTIVLYDRDDRADEKKGKVTNFDTVANGAYFRDTAYAIGGKGTLRIPMQRGIAASDQLEQIYKKYNIYRHADLHIVDHGVTYTDEDNRDLVSQEFGDEYVDSDRMDFWDSVKKLGIRKVVLYGCWTDKSQAQLFANYTGADIKTVKGMYCHQYPFRGPMKGWKTYRKVDD